MKLTPEKYRELEGLLGELQLETIRHLLKTVKGGSATSGDIRNALALLKDNSITLDNANGDAAQFIGSLKASVAELPFIDASLDLEDDE